MLNFFQSIRQYSKNMNIIIPLSRKKIGLWKWDIKKNQIYFNNFWYDTLGHKKTNINTIDSWLSNIHAGDREKVKNSLLNYIKNQNNESLEIEYRLIKKNGEYIWLFLNGMVTKYKKEKPVRMDGIIFDITGQKQVEDELHIKKNEIEALYEESEAQNEEMAAIMDELQYNQMKLETANTKLLINETKFRKIFENSPIGIIQSSVTGKVLNANTAFCKIFGYDSHEDLLENLDNTSMLYKDKSLRDCLVNNLSKTDIVHALNLIVLKKDKSQIFSNGYHLKMTDEFTGEEYITTFIEDITQLKSSQFEHDLFFNNSGDLLSVLDFEGGIKQINTAWTSDFGWDVDYLKTINTTELIHPDDIMKTEKFLNKIKKSDSVLSLTNRYRTKNGEYRIIRWNCKSFKEMNLIFSSGRDETERYEAELDLKQMWDRLDIALKAAVIALWDFNIPEGSLSINRNMADFLGLKTHIINNATGIWKQYINEHDFISSMKNMKNFLNGGNETYTDEFRIKMPDGKYKWFFSRGKVVEYNSSGQPVRISGSAMDITEQKEAELKRIELELKMQQTQKLESLGVLAGGIAHDFNNLLTGILGNSDILLHELPEKPGIQKRILEIKKAAKMASELTSQMLAYSGRGSFIIEQINLNALITDMASLLEASISKKVKLQFNLLEHIPLIKGDATQIRQIIINLILNGSDAIDNNGIIIIKTSEVRLIQSDIESLTMKYHLTSGNYVSLEVIDSGCGIENDKLEQIFDPFYTTKFTGRGLGLAAVSGIIRSHNAGLLVNSKIGKGTWFKIYFPVSDEVQEADSKIPKKHPSFTNRNLTVLIADDEKYIRDLTKKMLSMSGYRVYLAKNGKELIKIFKDRKDEISCILLDLTMPEIDGNEALTEIRNIDRDIPIIITSGYSENDIITQFTDRKISGFLQKPFNLEDLITAIEEAIN